MAKFKENQTRRPENESFARYAFAEIKADRDLQVVLIVAFIGIGLSLLGAFASAVQ